MSKQTIEIPLKEFENFINEKQEDWQYVCDNDIDHDMTKGIIDRESVRKRISDNRFFKFEYAVSDHVDLDHQGLGNPDPIVGKQVFPKQITTTVYE